jgi:hypothetical protein
VTTAPKKKKPQQRRAQPLSQEPPVRVVVPDGHVVFLATLGEHGLAHQVEDCTACEELAFRMEGRWV